MSTQVRVQRGNFRYCVQLTRVIYWQRKEVIACFGTEGIVEEASSAGHCAACDVLFESSDGDSSFRGSGGYGLK